MTTARRLAWLTLLAAISLLCGCERAAPRSVEQFIASHWADPLPPQGAPPASFTGLEASLSPQACGQCHAAQWQDWQTSLHSRSMGPGLRWQLHLLDQGRANRCLRCHAPLAEQKALTASEHGWPAQAAGPPPVYVEPTLAHQGLVCAACHVRGHTRYGPPPRTRSDSRAHGGFVAAEAFGDSRFCAGCHQFPPDGPRIAGKLQEDTYAQWQASGLAGERSCQSCHMPERRHLWRGIHDPATTRSAIDVQLAVAAVAPRRFEARATVRNVGAGHHFPTYMVPKVELRFARLDRDGRRIELGRQAIGWTVDTAITREIEDTRIPAGQSRRFVQPFDAPAHDGWSVELSLHVRPGEHYERTFRDSLSRVERLPEAAQPLLREALRRVQAAEYELMRLHQRPPGIAN